MRRAIIILLLLLAVIVILVLGVAWYAVNDDSFLKDRVGAFVYKQTGRSLVLDGPLVLDLGRRTTIEANGIRFQNADWADSADMVSAGRLLVTIDIPSLWGDDPPLIPVIAVEDCAINLAENESGEANWDVLPEKEDKPEPGPPAGQELPVIIEDLSISRCRLELDRPDLERPHALELDQLAFRVKPLVRVELDGGGRLNGESLSVSGWYAPHGIFVHKGKLEHELSLSFGDVHLNSAGTVDEVADWSGANIEVEFSGPSIESVLQTFSLPLFSEGDFDFRFGLNTQSDLTDLKLDGDLGSLEVGASGQLDRLIRPGRGSMDARVHVPDMNALGQAFGVTGVPQDTIDIEAAAAIDGGMIRISEATAVTGRERLEVSGSLNAVQKLAGSELAVRFMSEEAGRWLGVFGRAAMDIGATGLEGTVTTDDAGRLQIDAELTHVMSRLKATGSLGSLTGPFEPDLDVDFRSEDPLPLAALAGLEEFPPGPVSLQGRIAYRQQEIHLADMRVDMGIHQAEIDGVLNPWGDFGGSDIAIQIDSGNPLPLTRMFGLEAVPSVPVLVRGQVGVENRRLKLDGVELGLDDHRALVNGILSLEDGHAGTELQVDLDIKDLNRFGGLFGVSDLPGQPLQLTTHLKPEGKGLAFQLKDDGRSQLRLDVDGRIADMATPLGVDATFDIGIPNISVLSFLAPPDTPWPDAPLKAAGRLVNERSNTRFDQVRLELGDMRATVDGKLHHDQRFDLVLDVRGPDASVFEPWVGQPFLPEPYSLAVQASGKPSAFGLSNINLALGRSRVEGQLNLGFGEVTRIDGAINSEYLDLSQWNIDDGEEEPAAEEPLGDYVFDDTPIMEITDFGVELDLDVRVAHLDLGNTVIRDIELGLVLDDSYIELNPLVMQGQTGGAISGHYMLDGRGAVPRVDINIQGQELRLGLAAVEGQDPATFPPVEIDLVLSSSGATRREMARALDGKVRIFMGTGSVAASGLSFFLSDFLTELINALNPLVQDREYTRLDCAVAAADIVSGQVEVAPIIFNSEQVTIISQGTVDLDTEALDLSFNSKPRKGLGLSASALINPFIKVGGRLVAPIVELDPAGTVVSGSVAVATAGLSILAKSMSDRFLSSRDPCGDARREIDKRDSG